MLNSEVIIQQASESEADFVEIIKRNLMKRKSFSIANCYLLSPSSNYFKAPDGIVESGRYRGHSTKVLAEYFANHELNIVSIERAKGGKDDEIARQKAGSVRTLT